MRSRSSGLGAAMPSALDRSMYGAEDGRDDFGSTEWESKVKPKIDQAYGWPWDEGYTTCPPPSVESLPLEADVFRPLPEPSGDFVGFSYLTADHQRLRAENYLIQREKQARAHREGWAQFCSLPHGNTNPSGNRTPGGGNKGGGTTPGGGVEPSGLSMGAKVAIGAAVALVVVGGGVALWGGR